jgi:hypothetical protein
MTCCYQGADNGTVDHHQRPYTHTRHTHAPMRKSEDAMCLSTSVGSGITATDAVEVCTRPFDSVLGTL